MQPFYNFGPGEHPPRPPGQHVQQPKLRGGQFYGLPLEQDFVAARIDDQFTDFEQGVFSRRRAAAAAQHRPHPASKTRVLKGLAI